VLVALAMASIAEGQLPSAKLQVVFPAGGRQGATVEVSLAGADLDEADRLLFSHPDISAAPKTSDPAPFQKGPQPVANRFVVTIKPTVPPGIYEVRALGRFGVSNPRAFAVGDLEERVETEPNNSPAEAGEAAAESTVNGTVGGDTDIDCFKFTAPAGRRFLIECAARCLDSLLDPTLIVLSNDGEEIDRSRPGVAREPVLDFTAPADGQYVVRVQDALYRGGPQYVYRLTISSRPHLDFLFPPAAPAGAKVELAVFGRNLPGGQPAPGLAIDDRPLEKLQVTFPMPEAPGAAGVGPPAESRESGMDGVEYRLAGPGAPPTLSNPLRVSFASAPVVLETEPNDEPARAQKLTPPCEVAGQFHPRYDQDWMTFDAKKGEVWWIEVFSQRLGLPTDPYLLVQEVTRNEKGEEQVKELKATDDLGGNIGGAGFNTGTDDPAFRLEVPADGAYRVLVRDLYSGSRGDPRFVYRLAIHPPKPDFRLVAVPRFLVDDPNQSPPILGSALLRKGGTAVLEVLALRRDGFDGEIQLAAEGLPPGVSSAGARIGPGQSRAALVLVAAEYAPEWAGSIAIAGKARIGAGEVVHRAAAGALAWPGQDNVRAPRARSTTAITLAVSRSESAPFLVEAGPGRALESPAGSALEVPVKVARRGEFKGAIAIVALNLPPNVEAKPLTINGDAAEGKLELNIKKEAPLGAFTFFLHAKSEVSYSRNPEAAKAAEERKAALEAMAADLGAAARRAAEARTAAEKSVAGALAAVVKAEEARGKAVAGLEAGAEAVKAAALELKAASERIKAEADAVAVEAEGKAKAAAEALAAASKQAADAAAAAKPANVSLPAASTAVEIRIVPPPPPPEKKP
jgi:hypothetical protein